MLNPDVLVAFIRAHSDGVGVTEHRATVIRVKHDRNTPTQAAERLEAVLALNGFVPSETTERDRAGTYFIRHWLLYNVIPESSL